MINNYNTKLEEADLIGNKITESESDLSDMYTAILAGAKRRFGLDSDEVKMLLTVHDELVFEVKDDLVKEVAALVDERMEHPQGLELSVPIKVDTDVGQNWGEMELFV